VKLGVAFGWCWLDRLQAHAPRAPLVDSVPRHAQSLYALGRGGHDLRGRGRPAAGRQRLHRGLHGAITLGILRPDLRTSFEHRAEDIVEIVKLGIFVVFGSLLTVDGLLTDGWAAVAVVASRSCWRGRWRS
jgi:hypothetical protein